jgi:hypothetical protein
LQIETLSFSNLQGLTPFLMEAISKLGFSFEIKKCPHLKNRGHRSMRRLSRPAERIFQPDGRDQGVKTFLR